MLYVALGVLGLGYLTFLVAVALNAGRKQRLGGSDEYWLGGRKFGGVTTGFTFGASQISASGVIGAAGLGYGVGSTFTILIVFALLLVYPIVFFVVGPRIRRATGRLSALTIPDFLGKHFDSKSIRTVAALLIIVLVLPVLVVQYRAAGLMLNTVFDVSYHYSVFIVGVLVAAYAAYGGYRAVAHSDVLQGAFMLGGLILLSLAVIVDFGGLGTLVGEFESVAPELLTPTGLMTPVVGIGIFISFAIALFGQPYIVKRMFTVADRRSAFAGGLVIAMAIQLLAICAVIAAMAGRVRYPDLANPDSVIFRVAIDFLSPWVAALLLLALLAALMSTVDSALLVVGSSLVEDLYCGLRRREMDQSVKRSLSRWGTFGVGAVSMILALRPPEFITLLMAQVSGVVGILFGIPLVLGVLVRRFRARGVWASWATGGGLYFAVVALGEPVPAVLVGLTGGLLAAWAATVSTKPPETPAPADQSLPVSVDQGRRRA